MKNRETRELVLGVLRNNPEALDNDNLLISLCLKKQYGTTDMSNIATITTKDVSGTYTRIRRKIQETNPMFASSERVMRARGRKVEEWKEFAKGV